MKRSHAVIIVGQGPAGLALAHALVARGVDALCLDADFGRSWHQTFGMFVDEAQALDLVSLRQATYAQPKVLVDDGALHLAWPYMLLDAVGLHQHYARGVVGARARVSALHQTHVILDDGTRIDAQFVVDARGQRLPSRCAQTAYGVVVPQHALPPHLCDAVFMDWRTPPHADVPPSFLYVLPKPDGRVLLEETVLLGPALPRAALAARLHARLLQHGVTLKRNDVLATEDVHIALDAVPPAATSPMAIGVRGGAVHPATGYSIARSLSDAPIMADAIAQGLAQQASPMAIARLVHSAVWPASARLTHALRRRGALVLASMSHADLAAFFAAFFRAPPDVTRAFLAAHTAPDAVMRAMAAVFHAAPLPLGMRVVSSSVWPRSPLAATAVATTLPPWFADSPRNNENDGVRS